jgi:hypothetical protein
MSHSRPEPTCVTRRSAPPCRALHQLQQPRLRLSLSIARARRTARKTVEAHDRFATTGNLVRRRAPNWSLPIALGQQTIQHLRDLNCTAHERDRAAEVDRVLLHPYWLLMRI